MAGATVRESVTLAGRAERARAARAFVGAVLGPGHPCGDVAVLLVSELFGNSVRHSRLGCSRGDGHGRGQGRGRRRPGRGHRPSRAGVAGAAPGRRVTRKAGAGLSSWPCSPRGGGGGGAAGGLVTWFECALEAPDCIPGSAGRDLEDIPGSMAYPELKGNGDSSMPLKRRSFPGIRGGVPQGPRGMVKAKLPEP